MSDISATKASLLVSMRRGFVLRLCGGKFTLSHGHGPTQGVTHTGKALWRSGHIEPIELKMDGIAEFRLTEKGKTA